MRAFCALLSLMALAPLFGAEPSPRAQEFAENDLLFFIGCVRSAAYDMMGKSFAEGDEVRVKYTFSRSGVERKGARFLYILMLTKRGDFGRLFQLVNDGHTWTVRNDANVRTKPGWALSTDPLGGIYSASLMTRALQEIKRKPSEVLLRIPALGAQPSGCTTYAQGLDKHR